MTDEELQQLVASISLEVFHKPFRHKATFNNRLRTTGGRYLLNTHNIEINPKAFEMHGDGELIGIIKHELCHYHLHIEGKGYKHRDQDFRDLLKRTNAPRFCSSLTNVAQKRRTSIKQYAYLCTGCGLIYKRKIRMNPRKYRCSKCLGGLKEIN